MTNGNSAELANLASKHCLARTYKDGWIFENTDQLRAFVMSALSVCADGGKGEAVATLHDDGYWTWKKGTTPPHESNYAGWRMDVYATPQAECAAREKQNVMNIPLDAAATMADYAPQAECAPREAQPVTFVEGDEVHRVIRWNKDIAAFDYEIGISLYDAPTPERAQCNGTVGGCPNECSAPCSPPERADAEKDAVRYRWMRDQNKRMHYTTDYQPDGCTDLIQIEVPVVGEPIFTPEGHFDFSMELDRAIDAAILAANKEPQP